MKSFIMFLLAVSFISLPFQALAKEDKVSEICGQNTPANNKFSRDDINKLRSAAGREYSLGYTADYQKWLVEYKAGSGLKDKIIILNTPYVDGDPGQIMSKDFLVKEIQRRNLKIGTQRIPSLFFDNGMEFYFVSIKKDGTGIAFPVFNRIMSTSRSKHGENWQSAFWYLAANASAYQDREGKLLCFIKQQ